MNETERAVWDQIEAVLASLAQQQEEKVLAFARRLRPGLTAEDVRNPHDYNELTDPDFQYEDGMLAGLHTALSALRARRRDRETHGG
jgi:hypothetical protein